ncbi:MAG TPA: hypothetical protein VGE35_01445 [Candidatus Paceibacterota bacterium]
MLRILDIRDGFFGYLYAFLYGLIPLFGGIVAVKGYKTWGGLSTALGKAIFFIGWGLIFWGIGETIWSYYNFFLDVEVPYPSWADLFFAPSMFLYNIGAIFLAMTTGTRFALRSAGGKLFSVLTPVALFAVTYYVLIVLGHGGEIFTDSSSIIKSILDIAYPLGDAIALSVAVVVAGLSFKYIGGMYKYEVIAILFGLASMFVADCWLSYTTSIGTSYSPDLGDLFFTIAVSLITFGLLGFNKIKQQAVVAAD